MRAISTRRSPSPPGSPWPVAARSRSGRSSSWRTCRRISHEKIRLVTQSDTHDAIDAVWRIESARLIAGLTRITRDVGRAKRTLREARVPFEVPRGAELTARLASVLEVIYLVFNEGYSATAGDDWVRPELCEDALRLGRILAELVPEEPEVHGLVGLLEI